jgi:hypothetical protein
MGVRAWVGEDQEPLGSGVAEVVMTDDAGNEVSREMRGVAPGMVVTFAHFVDLDDGRRITTGGGVRREQPGGFSGLHARGAARRASGVHFR